MYKKFFGGWIKHMDFIALDIICMHIGLILAYWLYKHTFILPYTRHSYGIISIIMTLISFLTAVVGGTFSGVINRGWLKEAEATLKHTIVALVILTLTLFTMRKGDNFSRMTLAHAYMFYAIIGYAVRMGYKAILMHYWRHSISMLVITTKGAAENVLGSLSGDRFTENILDITGICLTDVSETGGKIGNVDIVADADSVIGYALDKWVDRVFISLPLGESRIREYIHAFEEMGVTVHIDLEGINDLVTGKHENEVIGKSNVMTSVVTFASPGQLVLKRIIDIIGGLVGCVLMGIFSIFVIPMQQKASPGPVFFRQERIGLNGKRFKMLKFRSMCMNADALKKELMSKNRVADGMMFKLEWDPRIIGNKELPDGTRKTGIGEFIRRTSIDEFPQFINVLKGEMSLVGTRPPTVDEWEKYDLHHRIRMAAKPGITGMWQVSGRSEITDFEEVVRLDLQYIKEWNIALDIKILFKTILVVLQHKGAM